MRRNDHRLRRPRPIDQVDPLARRRRYRLDAHGRRRPGSPRAERAFELRLHHRHGGVAGDDDGGARRMEPVAMPAHQILARQLRHCRLEPGPGQRRPIGVCRAVQHRRHQPDGGRRRRRFFLADLRQPPLHRQLQHVRGKRWPQHHVRQHVNRRAELLRQRLQPHQREVEGARG